MRQLNNTKYYRKSQGPILVDNKPNIEKILVGLCTENDDSNDDDDGADVRR